jgi:transmembrane sensor
MAEVHLLPTIGNAERQASEWIARLNADDVSSEDRDRFEKWRTSHQLHASAYEELAATWHAITAAGPLVQAVSFGQAMSDAAAVGTPRRRWMWAAGAAASVMIAISCWYLLRLAPESTFQTAIGEHATVSLPDDSILQLNTNTGVRIDYSAHARVIQLDRGEASFKVAHDSRRPFWVVVGNSWVRAVGTAFNVHVRTTGVRVTVSEGTVKVGLEQSLNHLSQLSDRVDDSPASFLAAGQQGDLKGNSVEIRSLSADELSRSVAWQTGVIHFEDERLDEVVTEIARYTTLQLVVEDDALRSLRLGGTFQAGPAGVESFVAMLKDGLGLRVRRKTNHVYIDLGAGDRWQGLVGADQTTPSSSRATE